ncbi:DUF2299 family protein [Candidatus Nitrosocosmicus hydrocola]|uniref:DUF2299 family protein n=1 Tax=Candidatus Nitrosocosmicus hydrocola TaxID=1826872 RepID=UPI0011E5FC58|nr:DUF2299 family protein [Candidatus Nitrosocosmicus hydrocola]
MQEILDNIYKWVDVSKLKVDSDHELIKSQKIDFIGNVTINDRYGYSIIILKEAEIVKITTSYRFNQQLNSQISNLKNIGIEFLRNMQLSLLQMNLQYVFIHKNHNPPQVSLDKKGPINIDDLESIDISKNLYFDGFNQNLFFEAVTNVINAIEVIDILYQR